MLCVAPDCCFLRRNLEPGGFLPDAAITWDRSDCKRDASSTETNFCNTSLISTCFGTLSPGTNTKTSPRSCGVLVTALPSSKPSEEKTHPILILQNQKQSQPTLSSAFEPHWFNHMLLTHHIGSLNLWLHYICNKRFHHFHIAVSQPKPWGLLSM